MFEIQHPVRIISHEYWKDSAGAGEYRGGLGIEFRYQLEAPETEITTYGEDWAPAFGLFGGGKSKRNQYRYALKDEELTRLIPNTTARFPGDTVIEADNSGGGGFGFPYNRNVEMVLNDVKNGFVSIDSAEDIYGVVMDPATLELDQEGTKARRNKLRSEE